MHILLCLGGCRTLCATMYVASPLNLLRRLPFILNTLCYSVCGLSSEPSCLVSERTQSINIYCKSAMCFATCETFMPERNICKRVWLSEILCILGMNPIWNNSYFFEQCIPKRVVYERTRISWNLPNAYSLVSRWLPNTLCYNVCGISSEPVSAVAVYSFIPMNTLCYHVCGISSEPSCKVSYRIKMK